MSNRLKNELFVICIIALLVSLSCNGNYFFKNKKEAKYLKTVLDRADSLINANITETQQAQEYYKAKADSLIGSAKNYQKEDSINKVTTAHVKKQIQNYTPAQRNAVYDSIFGPAK